MPWHTGQGTSSAVIASSPSLVIGSTKCLLAGAADSRKQRERLKLCQVGGHTRRL